MPIDTRHPLYASQTDDWQRCRDTIAGEHAVRDRITEYLPVPPGMQASGGTVAIASVEDFNAALSSGKGNASNGSARYAFYASFAEFPEIVAPALNGIQGIIHSKPPEIELPAAMEYLRESATPDGDGIDALWELVTREIIATGRVSLLAEVSMADGQDRLRLCPYVAESLINWRTQRKIDGGNLTMAVLEELNREEKAEDEYQLEDVTRWRELRLIEGRYAVRMWEKTQDGDPAVVLNEAGEEWTVPGLRGQAFDRVPLTVINATDTGLEYGSIPLLPMARRALAIFRKTADYHRSLYIKGDPQICLAGVDKSEVPGTVGGGSTWTFTNPDAKWGFLDIDGNGIPLMREAIQDEFDRFAAETGRLMEGDGGKAAESGEALRRRQSMQMVTIRSLVINAAQGLQASLRQVARLLGLSDDQRDAIFVTPNLDFLESPISADDAMKWISAKNMGFPIAAVELRDLAQRANLVYRDAEEAFELIDSEGPALGLIGSGNQQGEQTEQ